VNDWNTSGVPFRKGLRRRFALIADSLKKLLGTMNPPAQDRGSQRMCPFCGLITPRSKGSCLECGKSFRGDPLKRKDATQE
jgi:hypothetical protein